MIEIIKKLIANILGLFPLNYIVFESIPDFSDNTRSVYDEIKKRLNICDKYKLVWLCNNKYYTKPLSDDTVLATSKLAKFYYSARAKYLVSCNAYVGSFHKRQTSLYLGHGIALKSMKVYEAPSNIDKFIGVSDYANSFMKDAYNIPIDKFINTGYPRNDNLFVNKREFLKSIFGSNYKNIVVWYPTFRQHINSNVKDASENALPLLHDINNAKIINDFAREHDILIIIKPHFSQVTSKIHQMHLSNILFISNKFFSDHNINSYEFVGSCDALVTDYSSIYYDYLLCDKPIAAVWEDIDEYRENRGFCVDIDFLMKGAEKIYNVNDFIRFLNNVSKQNDILRSERNEIKNLIFETPDNHSAERVVDFVERDLR